MNTILVPTDFSSNSSAAVDFALQLADESNASLHLLNVVSLPAKTASMIKAGRLRDAMKKKANEDMEKMKVRLAAEIKEAGLNIPNVEFQVEGGDPVDHILDVARSIKADLILMGTLGAGNLDNVVLGSTTGQVIKNDRFPVLAVPKGASYEDTVEVVLATDLTENDNDILARLIEIAVALEANITLLHIAEASNDEIQGKLNEIKDWAAAEHNFKNLTGVVAPGEDPIQGINQYVSDNSVHMLAMVSRKRGFFENIFHSSMTKKMAMHTPIPLLTFRK